MVGPTAGGIDRFLGHRIKGLRVARGMAQRRLASQLGVTPEQLCKYERGISRLSASRLLVLAQAFEIQVCDLFQGYQGGPEPQPELAHRFEKFQILLNLLEVFREIAPDRQETVAELIRALAPPDDDA